MLLYIDSVETPQGIQLRVSDAKNSIDELRMGRVEHL